MMAVDPAARHVRQRGEILLRGEHLGLEATLMVGRGPLSTDGAATHDLTHHWVDGQIFGIVDAL